ncbi:MAG: potassium-transporting ATPase subunit KdpC [Magnetococcales bacterium]|nr:potassium-transporting ATPase subunit KdpC [Magnetococcales bacterium]
MIKELKSALLLLLVMTLLTGGIYPALVTGLARAIFPFQSSGSFLEIRGEPVASALVGQPFSERRYFWGRPSATTPMPYHAASSNGSNLGPLNPALEERIKNRIAELASSDPGQSRPIPVDLVTASASGLDPHISPAAALWQLPRVARERNIPESQLKELLVRHTEERTFGLLGEPRVNVMTLNLAMDRLE